MDMAWCMFPARVTPLVSFLAHSISIFDYFEIHRRGGDALSDLYVTQTESMISSYWLISYKV